MIYNEKIGVHTSNGLISAVPHFLMKEGKSKIILMYMNGLSTQLSFDSVEERDLMIKEIAKQIEANERKENK